MSDAFKATPGKITVATAGRGSAGSIATETLRKLADISYKHVSYDGGNPAVIATVSGETEVTIQLASEQVDMLRAKKLRALTVLDDKPLQVEGYGEIPPITQWFSNFKPNNNYFGIFIPIGVPDEVITTLNQIWKEKIANSEVLKKYAANLGAVFNPSYGQVAMAQVTPYITFAA